ARIADGARQLEEGLTQGAAKLRTAILFEDLTGVNLTGAPPTPAEGGPKSSPAPNTSDPLTMGLKQAASAMLGASRFPLSGVKVPPSANPAAPIKGNGPREQML